MTTATLKKYHPPIMLINMDGKEYMATFHDKKVTCVEVSVIDSVGYQFYRQLWEPYGKQKIGKKIKAIIDFAEAYADKQGNFF